MIALRPPEIVMRLQRLGAAHPTRLSFLRQLIRRATKEQWRVRKDRFELDNRGFGRAVYAVETPARVYSLVAFSTPLDDENRSDRVIAQAWDTSYVLYDGLPDHAEIVRLEGNAPLQEAGRFTSRELVLARANKSVRLFEEVVTQLAQGRQPDEENLLGVGYLLRTTAVYGNGKFGIADRDEIESRPELAGSFQAEMLTVWLIRSFTLDLVDHIAHCRNPAGAARLAPDLRRALGVGNATGLGMAPFLVRHPLLTHSWFLARETALARVRSEPHAGEAERKIFSEALADLRRRVARWHSDDNRQAAATRLLINDLDTLAENFDYLLAGLQPWDALYRFAEERLSMEGQEACVSLILEPHGALIDDLGETMKADETPGHVIDGRMSCGALRQALLDCYFWAARIDFDDPAANARFWYVSAEKLEPRLGERFEEDGAELEQPLATARDALSLAAALALEPASANVAGFLLRHPQWRHAVRRAQIVARFPYAEIHDNLIGADLRPVDILRAKLAFFGARSFDPRSDRWLRIALFSGEDLIEDVATVGEAR
ncbi:hypothetical protein EJ076_18605 [Mesorhizobium sp. M7D.F.Ca.US.005.01.1.1]|uniref:hypothetical protein n=1 Tax=Mesorhizobium sp. M7D.F.Ca.US.005.01.1.1 TaxID=2493678 RepID=UPI000F761A2E|nr:hypothetical protein [Mesorhizobium sp. M7D.F.Ca.US.005.01.1.1]AZO42961.1 hypothetical protein EJ076_18605 [Mesorhizobium sp. M7D.F.Ca.US.005.01.1.1]